MNPVEAIRAVTGWTQARLALAGATSQPTIASYESETKSPTWRTVQAVAMGAGLACYPFVGSPMTREEARSLALHRAIVSALHASPERVRSLAADNLVVMRRTNPNAAPLLDEWAHILDMSDQEIASRALDPSEHGRELRQVSPFAGVLNAAQRAAVYRAFRAAAR